MSSSPSRALAPVTLPVPEPSVEPFPYETVAHPSRGTALAYGSEDPAAVEAASAARDSRALAQAREQGRSEAQQAYETLLAKERAGLAEALAQFTRDRAAYFQKVEGEVVQLALSIARKILHREAQLDPLLLAGIVRVALEKIDGATGVILRLHPQHAADWRRYLTTHMEPADQPEIIEDPAQPPDHCTLETSMGTAAFGLDIQLKEIEHGLMDLLAARPGAAS